MPQSTAITWITTALLSTVTLAGPPCLVVNGDAETGNLDGWSPTDEIGAVESSVAGTDGLPDGTVLGGFVFTAGLGSSIESCAQTVDVSASAAAIDAGRLTAALSGALQSRTSGGTLDTVVCRFDFLAEDDTVLLSRSYVDESIVNGVSDWHLFDETVTVPTGTRALDVTLTMQRNAGMSTDAFADLICVTLGSACLGDLNGDGVVDGADLGLLLGAWGSDDPVADLAPDGVVDGADRLWQSWFSFMMLQLRSTTSLSRIRPQEPLEPVAKKRPRAEEPGLDSAHRRARDRGDLPVGKPFHVLEDDHGSIRLRQTRDLVKNALSLLGAEQVLDRGCRVRIDGWSRPRRVVLGSARVERDRPTHLRPGLPQDIDGPLLHDPCKPDLKSSRVLKGRKRTVGPQERILDHVLRELEIAQDPERDGASEAAVLSYESLEELRLAREDALDVVLVFDLHLGRTLK